MEQVNYSVCRGHCRRRARAASSISAGHAPSLLLVYICKLCRRWLRTWSSCATLAWVIVHPRCRCLRKESLSHGHGLAFFFLLALRSSTPSEISMEMGSSVSTQTPSHRAERAATSRHCTILWVVLPQPLHAQVEWQRIGGSCASAAGTRARCGLAQEAGHRVSLTTGFRQAGQEYARIGLQLLQL